MKSLHTSRVAASIEVSPRQAVEAPDLQNHFPKGVRVYISDLGTESDDLVVRGARRLCDLGFVAVPHIAARRYANAHKLENRLRALVDEAGVQDILLIGGDVKAPAGDFSSSMEVLATGFCEKHGIRDIGIAGHPEGSPDFSPAVALEALRLKAEFGKRTGARLRVVTQFGFDGSAFVNWAQRIKSLGIDLPIHIGVAGPAKITTLLKYAAICGVGNSLEFLRKRGRSLATMSTSYSPESVVELIEAHRQADPNSNIEQIHVFTFGGIKGASQWLRERGTWNACAPLEI